MTRVLIFCGSRAALEDYDRKGFLVMTPNTADQAMLNFNANPNSVMATPKAMATGWHAPPGTFVVFDPSWPYDMNDPFTLQAKARATATPPCGYSEPESKYCDPETGAHRTARCEGGARMVVRGTGQDSVTDGKIFISSRPCPRCIAAMSKGL